MEAVHRLRSPPRSYTTANGDHLRAVFGESEPLRVSPARLPRPPFRSPSCQAANSEIDAARRLGRAAADTRYRQTRAWTGVANGAEQIAVRARDAGFEVVYEGIRFTAGTALANAALRRGAPHRTSVLSGSLLPLVSEVLRQMREAGIGGIPVVVGGIVPQEDVSRLKGLQGRTASIRRGLRQRHHPHHGRIWLPHDSIQPAATPEPRLSGI